jgi:hypothetical protein
MIKTFYGVRRNLLLRFRDDAIDETLGLAMLLQVRAAACAAPSPRAPWTAPKAQARSCVEGR